MNSRKTTIATIRKFMELWTYRLGLRWWNVSVTFLETEEDTKKFKRLNETVLAQVFSDWRYMEAIVQINLPMWRTLDEYKIEVAVIHELCHILVNEMREGDIDHEERVVTTLQKAFMWTAEDVRKEKNGND